MMCFAVHCQRSIGSGSGFFFLPQIFNFKQKPAGEDTEDEDLSDSEDSVYSGLEDSGSDSEEDEEEEERSEEHDDGDDDDDNDDNDSDLKVEPRRIKQVQSHLCWYCLDMET